MKLISLWQPWASLCALGVKTIETRGWNPAYRGPLAIHATLAWNEDCRDLANREVCWGELRRGFGINVMPTLATSTRDRLARKFLPFGAIIGVTDLVDCVRIEYCDDCDGCGWYEGGKTIMTTCRKCGGTGASVPGYELSEAEAAFGNYQANRYGLILRNPKNFAKPIPFKARQAKLLDIPPDVMAQIESQRPGGSIVAA